MAIDDDYDNLPFTDRVICLRGTLCLGIRNLDIDCTTLAAVVDNLIDGCPLNPI
ncbi:MAG: hypothetical protein VYE77_12445 [Planctomycetota bacterium]|nr:hypothetical protein [Planctomycetota bacterium]